MGLFDFFKKPVKIQDEVFGELTIDKGFVSGCDCFFKPLDKNIECLIDAGENGPNEEQRNFYKSIEQNYPLLRQKIVPIMLDTFQNWKEDFEIKDFDSEFSLSSISLPKIDATPVVWQVCYSSIHDDHDFTIKVVDLNPEDRIAIDG